MFLSVYLLLCFLFFIYFPGVILSVVLFCMCCSRHNKNKTRKKRETRAAAGNTCSASCCTATELQAHRRLNSPSELCFDGFHLVWLQIVALMSVYVTRLMCLGNLVSLRNVDARTVTQRRLYVFKVIYPVVSIQ